MRAPVADPVDHLLALDPGRRGIERFFQPGGARRAAEALRRARRVLVTTGFVVDAGMPETDGPPGAAALGRALRALGASVGYVTDALTAPVLAAALRALGEPTGVAVYPDGPDAAREVLRGARPTHLVAIERPARSSGGDYLTMRGQSVARWNSPIDELFVCCSGGREAGSGRGWAVRDGRGSARPFSTSGLGRSVSARAVSASGLGRSVSARAVSTSGPGRSVSARAVPASGSGRPVPARAGSGRPFRYRAVTVGVGDGGNEVGMGNVHARLVRQGGVTARIAATVCVDHLVVAGVSNWGAYGIVAQLGLLARRPLLHSPAQEREMVTACVAAGACDGITRRREATVDALSLDTHAAMVALLGVSWAP